MDHSEPDSLDVDSSENEPATTDSEEPEQPTQVSSKKKKERATAIPRPYPRRTLEDALRIPDAIKSNNGGQPWSPDQVARAVDMGMSSTFFYLSSAARDYGLTEGTRDAAFISITDLGRRAVYPESSDIRYQALLDAFFSVDLFKQVVDYYHGSKLPEEPYRSNTLTTTFGLNSAIVEEFVEIFEKNARFVGVGTDWNSSSSIVSGTASIMESSSPNRTLTAIPTSQTGEGQGRCFVAMPFGERGEAHPIGFFKEVYKSLLEPAIREAGFEPHTADRQGSDIIQSTIVNELLNADLVVADLTEHNPNVLFELGMRMNADLPVALIRAKGTGAIFDVDNLLRVEEYNPNLWPSTVERDLVQLRDHIKAAWENRETTQTFMGILKQR